MKRRRQLLAAITAAALVLSAAASFANCAGGMSEASNIVPASCSCCQAATRGVGCAGGLGALKTCHGSGPTCACAAHQPSRSEAMLPTARVTASDTASQSAPAATPAGFGPLDSYLSAALDVASQHGSALLLKAATGPRSPPAE